MGIGTLHRRCCLLIAVSAERRAAEHACGSAPSRSPSASRVSCALSSGCFPRSSALAGRAEWGASGELARWGGGEGQARRHPQGGGSSSSTHRGRVSRSGTPSGGAAAAPSRRRCLWGQASGPRAARVRSGRCTVVSSTPPPSPPLPLHASSVGWAMKMALRRRRPLGLRPSLHPGRRARGVLGCSGPAAGVPAAAAREQPTSMPCMQRLAAPSTAPAAPTCPPGQAGRSLWPAAPAAAPARPGAR